MLRFGVVAVATLLMVQVAIDAHKAGLEWKCLGEEVHMKEVFSGFMECAKEILPKEDVEAFTNPNTPKEKLEELGKKAHENMCLHVCQWKKQQHLLTSDGKLNETANNEYIDKTMPEAARAGLKAGIKACHTENSNAFDDSNNCAGYKPFQDCMVKSVMEVCKLDHLDTKEMMG